MPRTGVTETTLSQTGVLMLQGLRVLLDVDFGESNRGVWALGLPERDALFVVALAWLEVGRSPRLVLGVDGHAPDRVPGTGTRVVRPGGTRGVVLTGVRRRRQLYKHCYSFPVVDDVTAQSLWRPLRLLMQRLDDDIARIYEELPGAEGLRPAWVHELLRLDARGPMTIRALADSVGKTHSALSQKVAAMARAGFVETRGGDDARTRVVHLTERGRRLVGRMRAEWRATEAALAELEAETPYPLSRVVRDLEAALDRRSFHDRLAAWLALDPPPA